MLTKLLISTLAVFAVSACASSGTAERHDHNRDAKQGTAYPTSAAGETVKKPAHDHRGMK